MAAFHKVAVVIPCYNAQATLTQTLDSALAQSLKDFYIVAVNDGSQDETVEILADYTRRYPKKFYVINQSNQGQTVAKNVGLKQSRSEFVAFLDSDDLWLPDKLEKQVALMSVNLGIGLCYTAAYQIDRQETIVGEIGVSSSHRGRCFNDLIVRNNIVASSVMVRRSVVERAGFFDESLRACENWDLWIRIASDCEVEYIDEPLTLYRLHPNNMSKNFEKIMQARLQVIEKHLPVFSKDPWVIMQRREAFFKTHLTFAKSYIESLRLAEARRALFKALKIRPGQLGCYVLYLKTLLGPKLFRWLRARRRVVHDDY